MRILQITDLHLPGPGDAEEEEIESAWSSWAEMGTVLDGMGADFIINTGDICRDSPSAAIYKRYFTGLKELSTPVITLAGNHDNLELMKDFIPLETQVKEEKFEWLFLQCVQDRLWKAHHSLLLERVRKGTRPLLIFMHYPPLYAGSPYMDSEFPFADVDTILPLLEESPRPVYVFCGHYHTARTLQMGALTVCITPSPYKNIDPAYRERRLSHTYRRPFREIELTKGRVVHALRET